MSRSAAAGILGIVVVVLGACGEAPATGTDQLFLQSANGVTIVEPGGGAPSFRAAPALPSPDWSTVVGTLTGDGSTQIVAEDPSTGAEVWSQSAPGRLEVKALSRDGGVAVLEPAGARYESSPTITKFVIARRGMTEPDTIELAGNFAAEALSTDGQSLFVVQYSPARNPNRYQVRRLDLNTEKVSDVYTVDGHLQESMRGTARIQAMSPDGTRLYTLYTLRNGGTPYAFIHVLSLDEQWAHCIDLPPAFAQSAHSSTALTVSTDGSGLYVANSAAGMLAEVDTEDLTVVRTAALDLGLVTDGRTHATYGSASTLYVASGRRVLAVDSSELAVARSWEVDVAVTGLQEGSGGSKLYIGQGDEIDIRDVSSGESLGRVDPLGIGAIGKLGKVTRSLGNVRTEIICAC
jgi:outer membrane protein assembly factor BamB